MSEKKSEKCEKSIGETLSRPDNIKKYSRINKITSKPTKKSVMSHRQHNKCMVGFVDECLEDRCPERVPDTVSEKMTKKVNRHIDNSIDKLKLELADMVALEISNLEEEKSKLHEENAKLKQRISTLEEDKKTSDEIHCFQEQAIVKGVLEIQNLRSQLELCGAVIQNSNNDIRKENEMLKSKVNFIKSLISENMQ